MRLARDLGKRFGAQVAVLHVVPKGTGERALQREQEALDRFVREHGGTRRVRGILREATSVRTAIIRESASHDLVVMGASAQPSNADAGRALPVRQRGGHGRLQGQADGDRGQDQAGAGPGHLRRAARGGGHAGRGRRVRGAQPLAADRGRPLVRREHLPRLRVPRHRAAGGAQGEAGTHAERRAAGAERGEDDRPGHQAHPDRADGAPAADRPAGGDRLRLRRTAPRRSPPSWGCRSSSTPTSCRSSAATSARARPCGRACTCWTATS